jgi:hypothetical protein
MYEGASTNTLLFIKQILWLLRSLFSPWQEVRQAGSLFLKYASENVPNLMAPRLGNGPSGCRIVPLLSLGLSGWYYR